MELITRVVWGRRVGTRYAWGVKWPVFHQVRKGGRGVWYLDRRVCCNVCEGGTTQFSTKKAAIAAAQD